MANAYFCMNRTIVINIIIFFLFTGQTQEIVTVGSGKFEKDKTYIWKIPGNIWENEKIIRTALQCCKAIYKKDPFAYLLTCKSEHNIVDFKFQGYHSHGTLEGVETRLLVAIDDDDNMFIAIRGTSPIKDWIHNLNAGLSPNNDYGDGSFHNGFKKKADCIEIDSLVNMIDEVKPEYVITTGHSQGGCVSTMTHLRLLNFFTNPEELAPSQDFLNFTFGAPMFGNYRSASYFSENALDQNMYHFVSTRDIVPAVLSIGHTYQTLKAKTGDVMIDNWVGHRVAHYC